ncbi:MAG TPA: hypothetical protein VHS09_05460 [Polyangiaceae bacterium]|nr:hypothetical protein [Polyangiaceae bacterium]
MKGVVLAVSLALAACDEPSSPPPKPAEPAPVASLARALGVDAGDLEPALDPPAPPGDLPAELAGFTTVDACVAARAAGDPVLGDALEAIGYDTLARDACRSLDAAKSRDAKRCDDILASTLKARCEARVAELAGQPDACPFDVPTHPELGRDASCLALATRDASLCEAAFDRADRASCAATAAHDAAPCKRLPLRADQARCTRDEQRWAPVLPQADAPPRAGGPPSGKVTLTGGAGGFASDAGGLAGDAGGLAGDAFALDVSRGVVVLERLGGLHVVVGSMSKAGAGFLAASPDAPKTFDFELVVPPDPKKAALERALLDVPGRAPIDVGSSAAAAFTVRVTKLEKKRGGAVEVKLDGSLAEGVTVHAEVTTFVRDIVSASAMLGARGGGPSGGLR